MGNTNNTAIHIPNSQGWSIFVFLYMLIFKNFTDLPQLLEMQKNFASAKNPKCLKFGNEI